MPIVETYELQLLNGPRTTAERWRVEVAGDFLLMGGSIVDAADWRHLREDLGVTHVLSLETEHNDVDVGVPADQLVWIPTSDDGQCKQPAWFDTGVRFARGALEADMPGKSCLYLHCQVGGSRTPMMLYALLRRLYKVSAPAALVAIRSVKPSFGTHPYHANYLASAEMYLAVPELSA